MAASPRITFTQEEQELCREAFMRFDKDKNGTIDSYELKSALEAFGTRCSDEEVFLMISEVDLNANGVVDFAVSAGVRPAQCAALQGQGCARPSPSPCSPPSDPSTLPPHPLQEFVKVLLNQKERAAAMNNENDLSELLKLPLHARLLPAAVAWCTPSPLTPLPPPLPPCLALPLLS